MKNERENGEVLELAVKWWGGGEKRMGGGKAEEGRDKTEQILHMILSRIF